MQLVQTVDGKEKGMKVLKYWHRRATRLDLRKSVLAAMAAVVVLGSAWQMTAINATDSRNILLAVGALVIVSALALSKMIRTQMASLPRSAAILAILAVTMGVPIWYVSQRVIVSGDAECLADRMNTHLRSFVDLGTDEGRMQAEAIARIELRNARLLKTPLCTKRSFVMRIMRVMHAPSYVVVSKPRPPRWEQLHAIAIQAMYGSFEFAWPAEYDCVSDYSASYSRRIGTWLNHSVSRATTTIHWKHVGDIGHMALYCAYET
jgi:hypothetical protein